MKRWILWLALALVACISLGFWRLRIDVDVFNLLPADSQMVEGLKLYQKAFGSSRDLIISLRSTDTDSPDSAARLLAKALESSHISPRVIWRSPLRDDPRQLAEFLAYLWFNQPPNIFKELTWRLRKEQLRSTLGSTLERMATSLRPQEVARLSHDPFALTDLAEIASSPFAQGARDPFASPDGKFRILFISSPFEKAGFWEYRHWLTQVTDFVEEWKKERGMDDSLVVRITGTPAFVSATGSGLLRDMQLAALGTLLLVAGLFWLVHRHLFSLVWLVALLFIVLIGSVGLGSMILGTLNAVSLGFAAILLGLAADYGLILYQEFAVNPKRSLSEHRSEVAPSILWAAFTTAGAFFMIGRSSLPGLTQLSTLVGIGILLAAGIMLWFFLPPLIRKVRPKRNTATGPGWVPDGLLLSPRAAWWITLLVAGMSFSVLMHRLPAVNYSTKNLGPKKNPAMAALKEIQREIGGFDDALWLILAGADEGQVAHRLVEAKKVLDESVQGGLLVSYSLPEPLWPRPDAQEENRERAAWLASRLPILRDAALGAGFTEESLRLTEQTFASWERFAATKGVVWPSLPGSKWVFKQFVGKDSGRLLTLGRLVASSTATQADLLELAGTIASVTGGQMVGWSLLSESLLGIMERDVRRVLIPMGVVLLLLLSIAFRRFGEVALSLATLGFSLLCLMAFMALLNWSWNLMNVMALPLLFGAGVDYSIHIQFALRRHRGDMRLARQTVGRAILLCGASTASGFGTLAFATNAGVASLGRVCAVGIVIAALISVFLLPVWWRTLRSLSQKRSVAEVS